MKTLKIDTRKLSKAAIRLIDDAFAPESDAIVPGTDLDLAAARILLGGGSEADRQAALAELSRAADQAIQMDWDDGGYCLRGANMAGGGKVARG